MVRAELAGLLELEARLQTLGLEVRRDEPMAHHTTWRVGGPADLFVTVRSADDLLHTVELAWTYELPCFVLGGGSNILVGDKGIRGLVVHNRAGAMRIESAGQRVPLEKAPADAPEAVLYVESGALLPAAARRLIELGWEGLTWAADIPGTVGGAVVQNAGAFGECLADRVIEVEWIDPAGKLGAWSREECGFGYRSSWLRGRRDIIVLGLRMRVERREPAELRARHAELTELRRSRQPAGPSAGSVFRNPAGGYAGKLIEEAGLKGRRIGGAHISERHANFIVNDAGASAQDILRLIELVRESVRRTHGVELELEIELVGEFA
ncbi:MAG: UDP-N-acetylmuramate dehydrogenase [Anaerolineae bacterium]